MLFRGALKQLQYWLPKITSYVPSCDHLRGNPSASPQQRTRQASGIRFSQVVARVSDQLTALAIVPVESELIFEEKLGIRQHDELSSSPKSTRPQAAVLQKLISHPNRTKALCKYWDHPGSRRLMNRCSGIQTLQALEGRCRRCVRPRRSSHRERQTDGARTHP
jgi:hypothetical protein